MGRQFRAVRRGSGNAFTVPNITTTSSTVVAIPNYGVTDVSTWAAGDYTLDAPDVGVRKTLFSVSSTSAARVIFASSAASFGNAVTKITFAGGTTVDNCVVLVGVNSTRWVVECAYPVASTAAGVTFS